MSSLYLECTSGISGDMTVGALLDLGADRGKLEQVLATVPAGGFDTAITTVRRSGIAACDFAVIPDREHDGHDHDMAYLYGPEPWGPPRGWDAPGPWGPPPRHDAWDCGRPWGPPPPRHGAWDCPPPPPEHPHDHEGNCAPAGPHDPGHPHGPEWSQCPEHSHEYGPGHPHHDHHEHRNLQDVHEVLDGTQMTDAARSLAKEIFRIVAQAESEVHGLPIEEVHFHEVGAVDSIADIIAIAVCYEDLREKEDITDVIVPVLYEGTGSVRCRHGVLPVPVPAVAAIARDQGLRLHIMPDRGEFVTPTGAAAAAALRTSDRLPEQFTVRKTGYGAGKRDYPGHSGLLRAMLIE